MATLVPQPRLRFFDSAANPLAGGKLFSYTSGTSTPQATYTDASGAVANTNPVVLDAEGFADVWLSDSSYKFTLEDANGVEQWTVDNVTSSAFQLTGFTGPIGQGTAYAGTFTTLAAKSFAATQYADQFAGATADVKINAAITALPAGGGIVDATGFGTTAQTIAAPVAIGSASKPVLLIVNPATPYSITVTGGVDVFPIANGSGLISHGVSGGTPAMFKLAATANVNSVICPADRTGGQEYMFAQGLFLQGDASATVASAMLDIQGIFAGSVFRDITLYNFPSIGLRIRSGTSVKQCSDILFENVWSNGGNLTNAVPLSIENAGASNITGINFLHCPFEHAGNAKAQISLDGGGQSAPGVTGLNNINFYGCNVETAGTPTAASIITLRDCANVLFDGVVVTGPSGNTNVFGISESIAGLTSALDIRRISAGGAATNYINNSIDGSVLSVAVEGSTLLRYAYNGTEHAAIVKAKQDGLITPHGAEWQRGFLEEEITLSTSGTTTDSVANLLPAQSVIEAVLFRVNATITGSGVTGFQVGDAAQAQRFVSTFSTLTVGASGFGLNHQNVAVATADLGPVQSPAAKVRITAVGGTPSAGKLRITVFYRSFIAPTS